MTTQVLHAAAVPLIKRLGQPQAVAPGEPLQKRPQITKLMDPSIPHLTLSPAVDPQIGVNSQRMAPALVPQTLSGGAAAGTAAVATVPPAGPTRAWQRTLAAAAAPAGVPEPPSESVLTGLLRDRAVTSISVALLTALILFSLRPSFVEEVPDDPLMPRHVSGAAVLGWAALAGAAVYFVPGVLAPATQVTAMARK